MLLGGLTHAQPLAETSFSRRRRRAGAGARLSRRRAAGCWAKRRERLRRCDETPGGLFRLRHLGPGMYLPLRPDTATDERARSVRPVPSRSLLSEEETQHIHRIGDQKARTHARTDGRTDARVDRVRSGRRHPSRVLIDRTSRGKSVEPETRGLGTSSGSAIVRRDKLNCTSTCNLANESRDRPDADK